MAISTIWLRLFSSMKLRLWPIDFKFDCTAKF